MNQIELNEKDTLSFIQFRKYQDIFESFLNAGVFNVRNGKATINFNADGVITEIDLQIIGYMRGKPVRQDIILR